MTIDNQIVSWILTILTLLLGSAGVGGLVTALKTKKRINANQEEDKKKRAEAAQIIEDTAAAQVIRVREEAERAATQLQQEKQMSGRWEAECTSLRREVAELTCRMDNDMESCKREIKDLQKQVATLKEKNIKLLEAIENLVKQIKKRGETPNCPPELIVDDWE